MATDGQDYRPDNLTRFQDTLLAWYADNHRDFPWRNTTDPYAILVSEIMSHQTQLSRVEAAYTAFLDRWPTLESLASATQSEVVGFWSTHRLGYNNRARYLHETATKLVSEHDGTIPTTPDELEELPGVGPYTANAVASFAFNNGNAVVDTNVKRILYRALNVPDDETQFQTVADEILPDDNTREWNNAMMELGATRCEQTPKCESCPWRSWCHAYEANDFTAPDVPTQPAFEGSRRQFRGRIIRTLETHAELTLDELGPRIRVDYTPSGTHGQEWLTGLVEDLETDGLVTIHTDKNETRIRLQE